MTEGNDTSIMRFTLSVDMPSYVFVPYSTHDRSYFIMGTEKLVEGDAFSVFDSSDVKVQTFFTVGDLVPHQYEAKVLNKEVLVDEVRMGVILYTSAPVVCHGTSVVAYSARWASSLRSVKPEPFGMGLVFRAPYLSIFHQKNSATLVISPTVSNRLKTNLEIT